MTVNIDSEENGRFWENGRCQIAHYKPTFRYQARSVSALTIKRSPRYAFLVDDHGFNLCCVLTYRTLLIGLTMLRRSAQIHSSGRGRKSNSRRAFSLEAPRRFVA
jgi:hypothetical protein